MDALSPMTLGAWLTDLTQKAKWQYRDLSDASQVSKDAITNILSGVSRPRSSVSQAPTKPRGATKTTRRRLATALCERFDKMVGLRELDRTLAEQFKQETTNLLTAVDGPATGPIPSNLPAALTPCIGRDQEVTEAMSLLRRPDVRLLTLTGLAGVGKTRLALEIAARARNTYAGGVFLVTLAALQRADLVIPTVALTLGLRAADDQRLSERLAAHVSAKKTLLVLDNFEHVAEAANDVVALLEACPHLSVLVTSRAALHVRGERQFLIEPLALPDMHCLPSPDALPQYSAVALFLQRAQAVKPDFALTTKNAAAVAAMCVYLDGLPLAIELAAVRVRLLPPHALLVRLEHRLSALIGGPHDLPERQQTLRGTIAWSYDLLAPHEQALFRRMAVFAGGCTIAAIQAVCVVDNDLQGDLVDRLQPLVAHHLVRADEQGSGEPRFGMLEIIREYAVERLDASGEADAMRQRFIAYYCALAKNADMPNGGAADQAPGMTPLSAEHDNLRTAIGWALMYGDNESSVCLTEAWWRVRWMPVYACRGRGPLDELRDHLVMRGLMLARYFNEPAQIGSMLNLFAADASR